MQTKQKIFFNSIIRYFYTSAIKLQFLAMDTILVGVALTFTSISKFASSIAIFIALYGSYAYFFWYMKKTSKVKLGLPSERARIGNLYADFRTVDL